MRNQRISKETEDGKTHYEVETMVNGKHRDLEIDTKGVLTEVEDETAIARFPPAKATIGKKAMGGRVVLVEAVTRGGSIVYEAEYVDKNGRNAKSA